MYSRSYYPEEPGQPTLPENYDGTAFQEATQTSITEEPTVKENDVEATGSIPLLSGLFGKGGLPFLDGIKMPKIGTEELLILAVAGFLLFSKNGDRECALILLFLLFIN